MSENTGKFESKIIYVSKEMNARERIAFKNISNSELINSLATDTNIPISYWGVVEVHNPRNENPDYQVVIVVTPDGKKYHTSSNSFFMALDEIQCELDAADDKDPFGVKVQKKQSKNNSGTFLTCSLI